MKISFNNNDHIFQVNCLHDLKTIKQYLNDIDIHLNPFLEDWFSDSDFIEVSTSGSTGNPSIVKMTKESMMQSAKLTLSYFSLNENDLIVNCLPIKFIAGKMMLVRAMIGNLHIRLIKPIDAPLSTFPEIDIAFTALTPSQIEKGLKNSISKLKYIETIIIGGAPVSNDLINKLQFISANCYASYGMTETITHIAIQKLNNGFQDSFQSLDSIGIKYHDIDKLSISAPHLQNSPIETTDIVEIVSPSSFKWLGRSDFVINTGGVKIFPENIENKISKLINGSFFIHKKKDQMYTELPVLVLLVQQNIDWIGIENKLNKLEVPKALYLTNKFVYTESGKINRIKSFDKAKEIEK